MTWRATLKTRRGRWAVGYCAVSFAFMFFVIPFFYKDILNPKNGWMLSDFILDLFTPRDWSLVIFGILYVAVFHTLISSYKKPDVFITGLVLYCSMNIIRTATMYFVTLEPPQGIILLQDPISSILYPDSGFAKDLFFSGHISTMTILVLIESNRIAKGLKIAGTFIMSVLLAWQHVHYTIDLLAAPIITYWAYALVRKWVKTPSRQSGT